VIRTTLGEAAERYRTTAPKGEFVLVVAGAEVPPETSATPEDAVSRVAALLKTGISRKDAIKQTAKELNLPKNVVYDAAIHITDE